MAKAISKQAAQKVLDEDLNLLLGDWEKLKEHLDEMTMAIEYIRNNREKLLNEEIKEDDITSMTSSLMKGLNGPITWDREKDREKFKKYKQPVTYTIEEVIRIVTNSANNVINRTIANKKNLKIGARLKELNQTFTKGSVICIDKMLREGKMANRIGVFHERRDFTLYEWPSDNSYSRYTAYGTAPQQKHYRSSFVPPDDAFDIKCGQGVTRWEYKMPLSPPVYRPIFKAGKQWGDENMDRLKDDETALVVDNKTSSTYVQVITSDPVRYVWIRRLGLVVAQN